VSAVTPYWYRCGVRPHPRAPITHADAHSTGACAMVVPCAHLHPAGSVAVLFAPADVWSKLPRAERWGGSRRRSPGHVARVGRMCPLTRTDSEGVGSHGNRTFAASTARPPTPVCRSGTALKVIPRRRVRFGPAQSRRCPGPSPTRRATSGHRRRGGPLSGLLPGMRSSPGRTHTGQRPLAGPERPGTRRTPTCLHRPSPFRRRTGSSRR
jgi:hypothetical protein